MDSTEVESLDPLDELWQSALEANEAFRESSQAF